MSVSREDSEERVLAATLYAEARGEGERGMTACGAVIRNRATRNRSYWGGKKIRDVCLHQNQFECWNGRNSIEVNDSGSFDLALQVARNIISGNYKDETGGADHYNNPDKEGYPSWTQNCVRTVKIGNHQFYLSKYNNRTHNQANFNDSQKLSKRTFLAIKK